MGKSLSVVHSRAIRRSRVALSELLLREPTRTRELRVMQRSSRCVGGLHKTGTSFACRKVDLQHSSHIHFPLFRDLPSTLHRPALSCCTDLSCCPILLHRPARLLVWAALSCCTGLGTSIALRRFTLYGTGCRRLMYSSTRAKWTRRERFLTLHWLLKARTRPERHVQTRSSLEHFLSKLVSMAGCVSEQPVCEPVAELG